ncbi:MAG TPA: 30S ribosomal protein S9 [Urbifossiella sp.]|jgi:small subunit ribosomal protein S9
MAEKKAKTEKKPVKGPRTFYLGTGRRKTSVARVRVTEGKGAVLINGRPLDDYFTEEKDRAAVLGPLKVTDQLGRVDVIVSTKGGGITGQAGAVCQGVARAIKTMFSPADEQKRYVFHQTTLIKAYRDEKIARERAKAPSLTPAAIAAADAADPSGGMIKKIRDSGFLTRDARMKERKKYGLRGARRGTQFSKR